MIQKYRHLSIPKFFRANAAYANRALYRLLAKEGYQYTLRIKSNAVLEREIEHLLTRPVGRPSHKPKVFLQSFQFPAKSWRRARRVVAKIEWSAAELLPRVALYRDQPDQAIEARREVLQRSRYGVVMDQGRQNPVRSTKLFCQVFKNNRAQLQLFALAYNLAIFLRRLDCRNQYSTVR